VSTVPKNIALVAHLFLALACLPSVGIAWAQSPAAAKTEWHGKIVDESGLPIQGIVVEAIDAAGRSLLETQSDLEGKFSFATVAAAKIRVKHPDF